jgi:hypothetical protein
LAEFPEPIRNDDAFAFLFGKGDFETCVGHEVGLRRLYHELVEVGDSIEIGKNESSTAGLFVAGADADQPVLGIVAGHACNVVPIGAVVTQPSLPDFNAECKQALIYL